LTSDYHGVGEPSVMWLDEVSVKPKWWRAPASFEANSKGKFALFAQPSKS